MVSINTSIERKVTKVTATVIVPESDDANLEFNNFSSSFSKLRFPHLDDIVNSLVVHNTKANERIKESKESN